MGKLTGSLGILAAILAIADLIHGPHNGDIHRTYIHVPEFIFSLAFLCLVGILMFRAMRREIDLNQWLGLFCFAIVFGIANLVIFLISGGGVHGDNGPISISFLAVSAISELCVPIALIGFLISAVTRKNAGTPILRR